MTKIVGGGGAIKAEGVRWLVLLGVCTFSPFEEGMLHKWMVRDALEEGRRGVEGVAGPPFLLWSP